MKRKPMPPPEEVARMMDTVFRQLVSGSRLTERQRDAQSAHCELYIALRDAGLLKPAKPTA